MRYRGKHRATERDRNDSIVPELLAARRELQDERRVGQDMRLSGGGSIVRRLERPEEVLDLDPVAQALVDPEQLRSFAAEHNLRLSSDQQ